MSGCGRRLSREKTFADSPKTTKFAKVFSLESFLLYGTLLYTSSTVAVIVGPCSACSNHTQ